MDKLDMILKKFGDIDKDKLDAVIEKYEQLDQSMKHLCATLEKVSKNNHLISECMEKIDSDMKDIRVAFAHVDGRVERLEAQMKNVGQ